MFYLAVSGVPGSPAFRPGGSVSVSGLSSPPSLGGTMARFLFAVSPDRQEKPVADSQPTAQAARRWWRRPAVIGLAGLVLHASFALVGLMIAPEPLGRRDLFIDLAA